MDDFVKQHGIIRREVLLHNLQFQDVSQLNQFAEYRRSQQKMHMVILKACLKSNHEVTVAFFLTLAHLNPSLVSFNSTP